MATPNYCAPRATRRVPGLPFGLVTNGGDRSYNNLAVANDLSVGSQAVIPLLYAGEIASLANLDVTVCDELNLASKDLTVSTANNFNAFVGGNVSIESNEDITINAGQTLFLDGDNIVINGNFAVPNINACSIGCNGNLQITANTQINLLAPNVYMNGTLEVCNLVCTGDLNVNTANLVLNSNLKTNNLIVEDLLTVNGDAIVTGTLNVCNIQCVTNLNIVANNLSVSGNVLFNGPVVTQDLNVNGVLRANLNVQAPAQLVDFNVTTRQLGYVTNAVLSVGSNVDSILGWNAATSTPSQLAVSTGAPVQLLTRDLTSGALLSSDYPNIAATPFPNMQMLTVDSTTGVVGRRSLGIPILWYNKQTGSQAVLAAATDVVLYDFPATPANSLFTYAAGLFTCQRTGDYSFAITATIDTGAVGSYFTLEESGVAFAATGSMDSQLTTSLVALRRCTAGLVYRVVFTNNSGITITLVNTPLPLVNDIKIAFLNP